MNRIKQTIKGLFLTALIVGAFGLNLNAQWSSDAGKTTSVSTHIENLLTTNTFAATAQEIQREMDEIKTRGEQGNARAGDAEKLETLGQDLEAAEELGDQVEYKISEKLKTAILGASDLINKVFDPAIFTITNSIGGLLGNDYIFAGAMGKMLHEIWVVSRNIVNIVFVLILLFLALRHIFGSEESSELKKALPKFVIMLIAINFSWLGARLVLDAANVATNVAFAIPAGTKGIVELEAEECNLNNNGGAEGSCGLVSLYKPFDATDDSSIIIKTEEDKEAKCNLKALYDDAYGVDADGEKIEGYTPPGKENAYYQTTTYCWENRKLDKFSKSNAAYHLTYSMAKVQNLPKATAVGTTAETFAKIGIGTLFSLFFQIVYLIAFASLFIVLIFRVAALWFMVAFSPFLVLLLYLSQDSQLSGIGKSIESKFSIAQFANWAFAPAKVGLVWSVGFLMITTGQISTKEVAVALNKTGDITSYGFSVSSLYMGMESIQELMWLLMTIGIIWVGTFAVFSDLAVVNTITDKIKNYGNDFAKEVAMSPTWAPIMPMIDPKTGGLKLGSYGKTAGPVGMLQKAKAYHTGTDDRKFENAHEKLKTAKDRNPSDFAKISTGSDEDRFKAFSRLSGLSAAEISSDPRKVKSMLKDLGVDERHSQRIIDHADKNKGKLDSPTDTKVTAAASFSGTDMKTAVASALSGDPSLKKMAEKAGVSHEQVEQHLSAKDRDFKNLSRNDVEEAIRLGEEDVIKDKKRGDVSDAPTTTSDPAADAAAARAAADAAEGRAPREGQPPPQV